ncbi:MAG: VOC family protein [Bacteroidales bacterium]|nr:VOC family protein [Bacteroidales bacterium]
MKQKITFLTLGVENLEKSINFYENLLGWKRSDLSNESLIIFDLQGLYLSLYDRNELAKDATVASSGDGFKGFTLAHNVDSEREVDELINELRDKGVKIVKEPQSVFWGGYSSYFSDPDGNLWEVAYNPYL